MGKPKGGAKRNPEWDEDDQSGDRLLNSQRSCVRRAARRGQGVGERGDESTLLAPVAPSGRPAFDLGLRTEGSGFLEGVAFPQNIPRVADMVGGAPRRCCGLPAQVGGCGARKGERSKEQGIVVSIQIKIRFKFENARQNHQVMGSNPARRPHIWLSSVTMRTLPLRPPVPKGSYLRLLLILVVSALPLAQPVLQWPEQGLFSQRMRQSTAWPRTSPHPLRSAGSVVLGLHRATRQSFGGRVVLRCRGGADAAVATRDSDANIVQRPSPLMDPEEEGGAEPKHRGRQTADAMSTAAAKRLSKLNTLLQRAAAYSTFLRERLQQSQVDTSPAARCPRTLPNHRK